MFVLFVLYSVACILDGPDMGNGDITGFVRKTAAKQMLKAARKADSNVYYSQFKCSVMPNYPKIEVMHLEQKFGVSFDEINLAAFQYSKSFSDTKEASVMIFKKFLERSMYRFSKDMAKLIIDSKAFKCTLNEPLANMPLIFTFSVPIAVEEKSRNLFEETVKTNICDVNLSNGLQLEEVLEYMIKGGPYISPFSN